MSAADRLDQIEARANAATEGPWVVDDTDEGWMVIQDPEAGIEPMTPEDADLMAAARTDVPALVAALRAVHQIAFDPDTINALEHGAIEFGPNIYEAVSVGDALGYARDALRDIRRAIEEAL